eukprot:Skav207281  [mRNA]  locus=scaffold434:154668:158314:- [translate_table: standard]
MAGNAGHSPSEVLAVLVISMQAVLRASLLVTFRLSYRQRSAKDVQSFGGLPHEDARSVSARVRDGGASGGITEAAGPCIQTDEKGAAQRKAFAASALLHMSLPSWRHDSNIFKQKQQLSSGCRGFTFQTGSQRDLGRSAEVRSGRQRRQQCVFAAMGAAIAMATETVCAGETESNRRPELVRLVPSCHVSSHISTWQWIATALRRATRAVAQRGGGPPQPPAAPASAESAAPQEAKVDSGQDGPEAPASEEQQKAEEEEQRC